MSFSILALICLVGLVGPVLALRRSLHLPVVLGELLAGILLGATGVAVLDAGDATFTFLGEVGFALVMFVAGTHVPMRDARMLPALRTAAGRVVLVAVGAVGLGIGIDRVFDTTHWPLYAVLMASSSAAIVLPVIASVGLGGPRVIALLPQVALADALCIVALPLAIDPAHVGRAAVGALVVIVAAVALHLVLQRVEDSGIRDRVHDVSGDRHLALELRISLAVLFGLAALAVWLHVSVMLAGFTLGLAVARVGTPRRVAKQLFALTEGFFGPLFFIWLGASLQMRDLLDHPEMIGLGLALGGGAIVVHLLCRLTGQPVSLGLLAASQMGVPVAAATVGTQLGVLRPGESSALILGALVTVAGAVIGGALAARGGLVEAPSAPGHHGRRHHGGHPPPA